MTNKLLIDRSRFTVRGCNFVAEASDLCWPAGRVSSEFEIADDDGKVHRFTYKSTDFNDDGEAVLFRFVDIADPFFTATIFND